MPSVELKFPIGVCKFAGGLIVCNSGCNTAIVFKYSEDGVVFDMAEITVSGTFLMPVCVNCMMLKA